MIITNTADVQAVWVKMVADKRLRLIAIRHGEKIKGGTARCGLSERGKDQVRLYSASTQEEILGVWMQRGVLWRAANTERNKETIISIIPPGVGVNAIEFPNALDLPDMGPNEEDLSSTRELATKTGLTIKQAFYALEEHGLHRVGEHPKASQERVRRAYEDALREASSRIVIYSGNSPVMNEAVGITGEMKELEALFLAYEEGKFVLLGRVAPEFKD